MIPTIPSTPSLPHPFCPPDRPPPALVHLRHQWILRNAPVLIQPSLDIAHGNGLLCCFYHFSADSSTCVLSLVFEGEASWEVRRPKAVNRFGSFLYRTHNYRTYCRTADIDHIAYHRCSLQQQESGPDAATGTGQPDWLVLHTTDFSGLQSWSKGSKGRFLYFYSLMHHFDLEMRREGWRQWHDHWTHEQQQQQLEHWRTIDLHHHATDTSLHDRLQHQPTTSLTQPSAGRSYRPVVYLNTGNHLMAPFSTNPSAFPTAACTVHRSYPLYPGDRAVAERFGQLAVRSKLTAYSFVPAWLYVPGGGAMQAERRVWQRVHHSVLLEGGVEVRRREEVEGSGDGEGERKERMSVGDGSGQVLAVVEGMDSKAVIEDNADKT